MTEIPPIVRYEYDKATRICLMYEESGREIRFDNVMWLQVPLTGPGSIIIEWKHSGPSGPWARRYQPELARSWLRQKFIWIAWPLVELVFWLINLGYSLYKKVIKWWKRRRR